MKFDASVQLMLEASRTPLTVQLTTITHAAPAPDDFAIQGMTATVPFGFVNANEGNTVLMVIANLQIRLAEVEAALEAKGLLNSN